MNMRARIVASLVAAVVLTVMSPSGTASADEPTAFTPGPPACLSTIWGNVNTRAGVLEFQRPVQELRFGDHVYRLQDRYTAHDADRMIIAGSMRHWMDACSGLPTQQVLMYGKYTTLFWFDGNFAQFQGSTVVRRSGQPWREVRGAINDKYWKRGGPLAGLGVPTTDETRTPTKPGAYSHFDKGASIYWSPGTGAHVVEGAIRQKWSAMGWENGLLGFPLTDEEWGRSSRYNHFQGGSIFWSAQTGAREVHGAIRDRWASVGWERSSLGLPVTDEVRTPSGRGAFNHFQGGSIYWSPPTGAHIVKGAIRDKWASLGWENGFLGFPTVDEFNTPNRRGAASHFERGSVYWSPETGAHEVHGAIRDTWARLGWENSRLGFPRTDEYAIPGGARTDFQNNCFIEWRAGSRENGNGTRAVCTDVPVY